MLQNQKAFTLIELLVTVAVIGVLLALAVPSFNRQILSSKSVAQGDSFIAVLNLARYEAVKRAKRVTICASSNSTTTTPSCTGDWKDGYIMFVDQVTSDGASPPVLGATPIIIKAYEKLDSRADVNVIYFSTTTAVTFIRYTALGSLARIANNANPIVMTSKITGCTPEKAREITIGLSGLVSVKKINC